MELGPNPASAQAHHAVINTVTFWLASTTAPRAADRRLNHQDSSFAATGLTELLILSGSLAAAAGAILRCEPREFGRSHGFSGVQIDNVFKKRDTSLVGGATICQPFRKGNRPDGRIRERK